MTNTSGQRRSSGKEQTNVHLPVTFCQMAIGQPLRAVTEIVKMPGRGHSLTIDGGWREVAEKALEFIKRYV